MKRNLTRIQQIHQKTKPACRSVRPVQCTTLECPETDTIPQEVNRHNQSTARIGYGQGHQHMAGRKPASAFLHPLGILEEQSP